MLNFKNKISAAFLGGNIENITRKKIRPLGQFSDFVVDELPHDIQELCNLSPQKVRDGLVSLSIKIDDILFQNGDIKSHSLSGRKLNIARVDAIYAYNHFIQISNMSGINAIEIHNSVVPKRLHKLVSELSNRTNTPPVLTYDDLVLKNPVQDDPRIFTVGEIGFSERAFYLGHLFIESLMEIAIRRLEEGISGDADSLKRGLDAALLPLEQSAEIMEAFRSQTNADHFAIYRPFFGKNPVYGTLGPSGRFSVSIPHATVLIAGDLIHSEKPEFYNGLFEFRDLFPAKGFARLYRRIDPGFCPDVDTLPSTTLDHSRLALTIPVKSQFLTASQAAQAYGAPRDLVLALTRCKRAIDLFTDMHIGAAKKYTVVPKHLVSGAKNGESVDKVLQQRIIRPQFFAKPPI